MSGGAPKPLYLHIGKHKTGTTSFQALLEDQAPLLAAQGITVLRDPAPAAERGVNCAGIAHLVLRPGLMTPLRRQGRVPVLTAAEAGAELARLNRALHARVDRAGVMSAEAFSFARRPGERARLDILTAGFRLIPVAVFRDPDAWRQSWAAQLQKMGLAAERAAGRGVSDLGPDSWLLDDAAIRAFWGPGRYLDYDAALAAEGSVLPALCRALDLDGVPAAARDIWRNRS